MDKARLANWPRTVYPSDMTASSQSSLIFHIDMDAFYAAIEQRDDPTLKGTPVIVGGLGDRGVVATASYEARVFGIRSAMPMFQARQQCPHGIYLRPRMKHYVAVSKQFMDILHQYSPKIEKLSLDEAFLDMSGTSQLMGQPLSIAQKLLDTVRNELQLTASLGIASKKFIAKIASDMNKPAGITLCPRGEEQDFLSRLSIEKLWGVGPKATQKLKAVQINTVGDITSSSLDTMELLLGKKNGEHAWNLAHGIDPRVVQPTRARKSLGSERTVQANVTGKEAVCQLLRPLVDEISQGLQKKNLRAGGFRVKIKYADFKTVSKQTRLNSPIWNLEALWQETVPLLDEMRLDLPIRLIGAAAYDLIGSGEGFQASLFQQDQKPDEDLAHALADIRGRFGQDSIQRGSDLSKVAPADGQDVPPTSTKV
jgi:DNA polymerase IV